MSSEQKCLLVGVPSTQGRYNDNYGVVSPSAVLETGLKLDYLHLFSEVVLILTFLHLEIPQQILILRAVMRVLITSEK